jgi:hypothetical protein
MFSSSTDAAFSFAVHGPLGATDSGAMAMLSLVAALCEGEIGDLELQRRSVDALLVIFDGKRLNTREEIEGEVGEAFGRFMANLRRQREEAAKESSPGQP